MTKHWRVFDAAHESKITPAVITPQFELIYDFKPRVQKPERYDYFVEFRLKNLGTTRVDDFRVDVEFPTAFVNLSTNYWVEVRERRTQTHMLLRKMNPNPDSGAQTVLYRGDDVFLFSMDYFVTDELLEKGALKQIVKATIYSGSQSPLVIEIPMTALSNF